MSQESIDEMITNLLLSMAKKECEKHPNKESIYGIFEYHHEFNHSWNERFFIMKGKDLKDKDFEMIHLVIVKYSYSAQTQAYMGFEIERTLITFTKKDFNEFLKSILKYEVGSDGIYLDEKLWGLD